MEKMATKTDDYKARILVVEEKETLRNVLSEMLLSMGYGVTLASNGEEGLELFHKGSYDLALVDLSMPLMDGWTLARRIKEKSPHISVCLMTGWLKEEIEPKIKESAADFVLFKPFKLYALQETVERMLA